MKNIYTLIQYKEGEEGWHDRCGDYHGGKPSDFQISYFTNSEEASKALGKAQFENAFGQNILLINGIDPSDWYSVLDHEEGKKLEELFFDIDNAAFEYRQTLTKEHQQKLEAEKQKQIQEKQLAERNLRKKIEAQERAKLAELLSKYGN